VKKNPRSAWLPSSWWGLALFIIAIAGGLVLLGLGVRLTSADSQVALARPWSGHLSADGGHVIQPEVVRRVDPTFPREAAKAGVAEAQVILMVLIDTQGHPRDPRVERCSRPGLGFEGAAVRAIRRWRYRPALQDGEPVAVYFYVVVDFKRPGT